MTLSTTKTDMINRKETMGTKEKAGKMDVRPPEDYVTAALGELSLRLDGAEEFNRISETRFNTGLELHQSAGKRIAELERSLEGALGVITGLTDSVTKIVGILTK